MMIKEIQKWMLLVVKMYNTRQKSLGHLQKYDKQPYSSQLLHPYALHVPPSPQYNVVWSTIYLTL